MSATPPPPPRPLGPQGQPPPLSYGTPQAKPPMTGRETYNVVTDTVTGVNIRLRDNLAQLISSVICAVIGAGVTFLLVDGDDALILAGIGAVGGLIAGVFLSGAFLAIYRAIRHMTGKHG